MKYKSVFRPLSLAAFGAAAIAMLAGAAFFTKAMAVDCYKSKDASVVCGDAAMAQHPKCMKATNETGIGDPQSGAPLKSTGTMCGKMTDAAGNQTQQGCGNYSGGKTNDGCPDNPGGNPGGG